jgi:hypothetical protein
MPLPKNKTELKNLIGNATSSHIDLWLPVQRSSSSILEWFYSEDEAKVQYLNWGPGQPNGATIDQVLMLNMSIFRSFF